MTWSHASLSFIQVSSRIRSISQFQQIISCFNLNRYNEKSKPSQIILPYFLCLCSIPLSVLLFLSSSHIHEYGKGFSFMFIRQHNYQLHCIFQTSIKVFYFHLIFLISTLFFRQCHLSSQASPNI